MHCVIISDVNFGLSPQGCQGSRCDFAFFFAIVMAIRIGPSLGVHGVDLINLSNLVLGFIVDNLYTILLHASFVFFGMARFFLFLLCKWYKIIKQVTSQKTESIISKINFLLCYGFLLFWVSCVIYIYVLIDCRFLT